MSSDLTSESDEISKDVPYIVNPKFIHEPTPRPYTTKLIPEPLDLNSITIELDDLAFTFIKGKWRNDNFDEDDKKMYEALYLDELVDKLQAENNWLRIKHEVLVETLIVKNDILKKLGRKVAALDRIFNKKPRSRSVDDRGKNSKRITTTSKKIG